jgi:4-hydroxybenzoate polyprenyltransferase
MSPSIHPAAPVLAVDLDGTLLKGDLFWELLVAYLRPAPWRVFQVFVWVCAGGLPRLKFELAKRVSVEGQWLPWNDAVVQWCETKSREGVKVVLATASPLKSAREITRRFGFISEVLGSDATQNLKAEAKAHELTARFGREGFDYAGNSRADLPVWRESANAWFVGGTRTREHLGLRLGKPLTLIAGSGNRVTNGWIQVLRPHQWLKNLLMLVPLLAAHRWNEADCWLRVLPTLAAVCCAASAAYILNDIADLAADRRHPRKRKRAFASGDLGLAFGLVMAAILVTAAAGLAWVSGWGALLATAGYFGLSVVYSLGVKKIPVADVTWLSGMYSYRVLVGGAVAGVMVSPWLLAYSTSLFLGLAFLKRYVELLGASLESADQVPGRGYTGAHAGRMRIAGVGASFASVVVLGFYLESPASLALYAEPEWLWVVVLAIAAWLVRIWVMAAQGKVDDDPVWFAAKDPVTWLTAGVCAVAMMGAGPL